ncbi:DR2241 family protein [Deinococcus lacus]|uniref:DR2241 family protein n=1 Tax=Deinococcus lacus TaxID=392561 RepID=UPI0036D3AA33
MEPAHSCNARGLREWIWHAEDGSFRPIRAWRTLPRGWRAVLNRADLPLGLRELYPGVTEDSHAFEAGHLLTIPWSTTARRLSETVPELLQLSPADVAQATQTWCGSCLKAPLWAGAAVQQTFLSGVPGGCPAPKLARWLSRACAARPCRSRRCGPDPGLSTCPWARALGARCFSHARVT